MIVCRSLTAEGVVPPADGDPRALTGLSIRIHIVTKRCLHSVILAHIVDAVTQESVGGHVRVAGLEAVREDDVGTLRLVQFLFFCSAVGVDVWACVWLTATEESGRMKGFIQAVTQ